MQQARATLNRIPLLALTGLFLAGLVVALWLPYRFNIPGWSDDWIFLNRADRNGLLFTLDPRPFINVASFIGYSLTPDSFVGMNVLMAALFIVKGAVFYVLLRRLFPQMPALAFLGGVLVIVFPGDVATFEMMTVYTQLTLVGLLLAVNALVTLYHRSGPSGLPRPGDRLRWIAALLVMWAGLGISYEVILPIVVITPVLLLWLEKRLSRRVIVTAMLWYAMPLLVGLWWLFVSSRIGLSYQANALDTSTDLSSLLYTLTNVYLRTFWNSWAYTLEYAPQGFSDPPTYIGYLGFGLSAGLLWLHLRDVNTGLSQRQYLVLLGAGIVLVFLGFAPFLPTRWRDDYFRTLLVAFIGSAVCAAALVGLVTSLPRTARFILAAGLVVLAGLIWLKTDRFASLMTLCIAVGLLLQWRFRFSLAGAALLGLAISSAVGGIRYQASKAYYPNQQRILQDITQAAPRLLPDTVVVLTAPLGETLPFEMIDLWRYDVFTAMLQFTYSDGRIQGYPCDMNPGSAGWYAMDCRMSRDTVDIFQGGELYARIPYDAVVVFDYAPGGGYSLLEELPAAYLADGEALGYNPAARIDGSAAPPSRVESVYGVR